MVVKLKARVVLYSRNVWQIFFKKKNVVDVEGKNDDNTTHSVDADTRI